jgi:hypothetical protein
VVSRGFTVVVADPCLSVYKICTVLFVSLASFKTLTSLGDIVPIANMSETQAAIPLSQISPFHLVDTSFDLTDQIYNRVPDMA